MRPRDSKTVKVSVKTLPGAQDILATSLADNLALSAREEGRSLQPVPPLWLARQAGDVLENRADIDLPRFAARPQSGVRSVEVDPAVSDRG